MWHSHQLVPYHYHQLSKNFFNIDIFDHNDNIDKQLLKQYESQTQSLWDKAHYANMILAMVNINTLVMRLYVTIIPSKGLRKILMMIALKKQTHNKKQQQQQPLGQV